MTVMQPQTHIRLALLLLSLWCCTPALAQPLDQFLTQTIGEAIGETIAQNSQDPTRSLLPQTNLLEQQEDAELTRISRREASEIARERFQGRVLSIRLENRNWRVRMDQEGNVFNVLVDADTGSASRAQD